MRVVDTSVWIEWAANTPLADSLVPQLPEPKDWIVPSIVRLELGKWLHRTLDPYVVNWTLAFSSRCRIVELDFALADRAADLWREHKLATADAIIYATAQAHHADLLTCDRHFEGLPGVVYVPKSAQ